jgi:hypothetical protein
MYNIAEFVIIFESFFLPALKVNINLQIMRIKRVFSLFLCAVCLPASLIMHVPISELLAQ